MLSATDSIRPNIILVTFDALTARDMSLYGYHRPTTPFISEWAKSASLFTELKSESNITFPTTSSLMTGKRLWTHQAYVNAEGATSPLRGDSENLPLALRENGYFTMAFIANNMASLRMLDMADSFNVAPSTIEFVAPASLSGNIEKLLYRLFSDKFRLYNWIMKADFAFSKIVALISKDLSITEVPPEIAFDRFLSYIDNNTIAPYFAWIHLLPPHSPYLPPEPYLGMFDSAESSNKKRWRDWNFKRAKYDEFIRYCDKQFEEFIGRLAIKDKLTNTAIILSSDHGESFEHGSLGHANSDLYEQVTHIPLIIKEADQTDGGIIHNLVEQIDIPATILDLATIPVPQWMEGRSLVPLMRGELINSRPVFSMALAGNPRGHQITKGTIAVWEDEYKLIHYLERKKSLLFNLKEDPGELNDLFDREPELSQRLLSAIQDNLEKANEKISKGNN
jgi:arylsulfatase A-like enzyme